ncbi:GIY-YIG nuclease family protein [Parasphingopyxis lamellibrachiae]|uniref:GIY-YIG nuclease family protein n=1 Tax=Parasphingopyxis lamellibrachiae TaxID=680125 RepID=UPI0013C2AE9F|nr:GIY-YIG nuclease family protein [Parasphingopyxis lamellibrachiae]
MSQPRFWLKAFWGFDPDNEGYLGFTNEGGRTRLLENYEPGDLILIYGADSELTAAEERRQVLGILEIVPEPIKDVDRMSETGKHRKEVNGWTDRWTYAVPVVRAWQFRQKVGVSDLFPDTYTHKNARVLGSYGVLVTEREAKNVMSWPTRQLSVYGMTPLAEGNQSFQPFEEHWQPTKGPKPSFGKREFETEDKGSFLYLMKFDGDLSSFMGGRAHEYVGKGLYKVGRTSHLERRCKELNSGFPPACGSRWRVIQSSRKFESSNDADNAESDLKSLFKKEFSSVGGEFFVCSEKSVEARFHDISRRLESIIGPPRHE